MKSRLNDGRSLLQLLLLWVSFTEQAMTADRPAGRSFVTRSPAVGKNGMACTSQPLASLAAIEILKAGGSAVDAAIAANAVLGVTEPMSCGIGGDLFAIVWDARTKKLHGLNASGRSPRGLTLEEFQKRKLEYIPKYGPLPVSVPGCVDGWAELHARFGKLPLEQVLAPAIRYAREGFPVTEVISMGWRPGAETLKAYQQFPGFEQTFMPEGRAPQHGETFRNPALAGTLEQIAHGGRDAFYRGEIARAIDKFMREVGGFLRYEDLAEHRSDWVEPVSVNYRGYDVWELPPNGQGIAALQMLQILKCVRPAQRRLRQPRPFALPRRGEETRVRRSSSLLCRSGIFQIAGRRTYFRRVCRQAAGTD